MIERCIGMLEEIINDGSVPRNICTLTAEIKSILSSKKPPPSERAAAVISITDEIGNDPNIPLHTRTLVWNIASQLEMIL